MRFNGILLSGLPGSGKSTAARELAPLLDWPIIYVGGLWREKWAETQSSTDMSFEDFMKGITHEEHTAMDAHARDTLAKGNVIGDMWHEKIAEGLPILRVFISAPLDIRAERGQHTGRFEGKSIEEIKSLLQKREDLQVATAKRLYGSDYDYRDPSLYHIVLNSGILTVEEKINALLQFFK